MHRIEYHAATEVAEATDMPTAGNGRGRPISGAAQDPAPSEALD